MTQSKLSELPFEITVITVIKQSSRSAIPIPILVSRSRAGQSRPIPNLPDLDRKREIQEAGDKTGKESRAPLFEVVSTLLFSDGERKKDGDRETERKRDRVFIMLSSSYKLRYGCNVPVVYYIAGSKPGQCNGPPPSLPARIYSFSPRVPSPSCIPTGDASHPLPSASSR